MVTILNPTLHQFTPDAIILNRLDIAKGQLFVVFGGGFRLWMPVIYGDWHC